MHAISLPIDADAGAFREAARAALAAGLGPAEIVFGAQAALFGPPPPAPADFKLTAPRAYVDLMETAILHSAADRVSLLYDLLWRVKRDGPELLSRASDPAIATLERYAKNVRRDIHKMHAFVRFREMKTEDGPVFASWFEPQHFILRAATPFFASRFAQMRWVIMTPQGMAQHLDGRLTFAAPVPKPDLPGDAVLDETWNLYFRTIFNPARVMTNAMLREMPKRYWKTMPETALIPAMVRGARERVTAMDKAPDAAPRFAARVAERMQAPSALDIAAPALPLERLRADAAKCVRCPLHDCATRTVFGEGPANARIMMVGEQPGDKEDLAGRVFVGPAGQVLDKALADAGVDRASLYLTNAVKHFKHEPRGKRRLHKTPERPEIEACRFWLEREIATIQPRLIVALGATAAQSLTGRKVPIQRERGRATELAARAGLITVHPSFLLRLPDPAAQRAEYAKFVADLKLAASLAV